MYINTRGHQLLYFIDLSGVGGTAGQKYAYLAQW